MVGFVRFCLCVCYGGARGLMDDLNTQMTHKSSIKVCLSKNVTLLLFLTSVNVRIT